MYRYEPGNYMMYKADSGALRFKVRFPAEHGQGMLSLLSKTCPTKILYDVSIGPAFIVLTIRTGSVHQENRTPLPVPMGIEFIEFWLTWYGCAIHLGLGNDTEPLVSYKSGDIAEFNIGFIKFYIRSVTMSIEWEFEATPVILRVPKENKFEDDLQWKELIIEERNGDIVLVLPDGAMIGGIENEPIYIARAPLFGSLCIGKYVPSKSMAFLPWGETEHTAAMCEILCGVNAKWVKTRGNYIPENALVGGYSEVREEPLYVGRVVHDNCLLLGKVHNLYSACYLPYLGKELCVSEYEILIKPNVECRGNLVRQKKEKIPFQRLLLDPNAFRERRHLIRMLRVIEAMREQRSIHGRLVVGRPMTQREILEMLTRNRLPEDPGALQRNREAEQAMQEQRGQGIAQGGQRVPQRGQAGALAQVRHARNMLGQGMPYRGQAVALGDVPQWGHAEAQRAQLIPQRPLVALDGQQEAQIALPLAQAAPQRDQAVAQRPERGQEVPLPAQEDPQWDQEIAQAAQEVPEREVVERGQGVAHGVRDLRILPWGHGISHDLRVPHEGQGVARGLRVSHLLWQGMPQGGQEMSRDLRVPQDGPEAPHRNFDIPQEGQGLAQAQGGQPQEALRDLRVTLPQAGLVVQQASLVLPPAVGVRYALPEAVAVQQRGVPVQPEGLGVPAGAVGVPHGGVRVVEAPPAHEYEVGYQVVPPPAAHVAVPAVVPYPGGDEAYWAFIRDRYGAARPYDRPF